MNLIIPHSAPFLDGFLLMASVIFAIGPQNAMLIRHGLRQDRAYLIASIFTLCDFALIMLGVIGIGQCIARITWLHNVIAYGGAAFLLWFSIKAFYAAWQGGQNIDHTEVPPRNTLIATALAVSLLNPGAIIDTTIIVGSVSSKYQWKDAIAFGVGAQTFSAFFFFALAGFTRTLAPLLSKPQLWRIIDSAVGCITAWIAYKLLFFEF